MQASLLAIIHVLLFHCGIAVNHEGSVASLSISATGMLRRQGIDEETSAEADEDTTVKIFELPNMMVSCKGQIMTGSPGNWTGVHVSFDGCGWSRGSCGQKSWNPGPTDDQPGSLVDNLIVLTQPQWGAYYHMVIDSLSRFVWMKEQYPDLVKASATRFHTGWVDEVGQGWARLVGIDTQAAEGKNRLLAGSHLAKKVYFPPSNPCNNAGVGARPHAVQEMRQYIHRSEALFPYVKKADAAKKTKTCLLIQRGGSRSLVNHDEVAASVRDALPNWNHVVFSASELPDTYEQCAMFYRAHLILGPHGAGFSNMICAKAGTPVIEFQQQPHAKDFELLSGKLGMPYFGIPTEIPHSGKGNVSVPEVTKAISVSVPKVREMVLRAAQMIQLG